MKTLLKIFVVLTLILITGLLSCGKSKNPVNPTSGFTIDNFPHDIGTVWVYEYFHHDLASVHTDTLIVKVDDTTRITNDSLLVYVVTSENLSYLEKAYITFYWHIDNDTVTYYRPEADSFIVTQKLGFPLEVGAIWTTGTAIADSNEVTDISPITVLGKTYQNSYQITRHYDIIQELYIYYSYVPNIGLIHSTEFTPHINAPNPIWNLITFYAPDSLTVADFPLQVGASWEYKVYDNLIDCFTECYDTCTITILDSMMDRSGGINENWVFDYPNQGWIMESYLNGSNLFLEWHHNPVYFSLDFPLTVGKHWQRGNWNPLYMSVLRRETIVTEAGIFKDAYYLKGMRSGFEDYAVFYIWIVKGIGIVKLAHDSYGNDFSHQDKTWELKTYNPDLPYKSFTIDKFPNYDGMTRTYQVYYSETKIFDTIQVHVAESSLVALWTYTSSDSIWYELVSLEDSIVNFYHSSNTEKPYKSYRFPLEKGNSWTTDPFGSVTTIESIAVIHYAPGFRFFPCYNATTYYDDTSTISRELEWINPGIGVVMKSENFINGNHTTWTLIDYSNP